MTANLFLLETSSMIKRCMAEMRHHDVECE